jgi:hypothetical protein
MLPVYIKSLVNLLYQRLWVNNPPFILLFGINEHKKPFECKGKRFLVFYHDLLPIILVIKLLQKIFL